MILMNSTNLMVATLEHKIYKVDVNFSFTARSNAMQQCYIVGMPGLVNGIEGLLLGIGKMGKISGWFTCESEPVDLFGVCFKHTFLYYGAKDSRQYVGPGKEVVARYFRRLSPHHARQLYICKQKSLLLSCAGHLAECFVGFVGPC